MGIVEDSREDFRALCRILGPDVDVRLWKSGEQAQAAFLAGGLDELALVIVDGNLPGISGVELVRELRDAPGGRETKVAMLSGSTDPELADRARAAGVDRFETKGATLQDLKTAIGRCLELVGLQEEQAGGAVPA